LTGGGNVPNVITDENVLDAETVTKTAMCRPLAQLAEQATAAKFAPASSMQPQVRAGVDTV
jgi:hypothetical protein